MRETGDKVLDAGEMTGDLFAGGLGGYAGSYVSSKLASNVATTVLTKKAVKWGAPKVAKAIGKALGKQTKRVFDKNNSGLTTVNSNDLDSRGNPNKSAVYKSVDPLREVVVTP